MLDRFHCFGVDHRGTGDSRLDVPDSAIADATADCTDMMEEWRRPSASLPTLEGYAEDICAIARHLSWKGQLSRPHITLPGTRVENLILPFAGTNI